MMNIGDVNIFGTLVLTLSFRRKNPRPLFMKYGKKTGQIICANASSPNLTSNDIIARNVKKIYVGFMSPFLQYFMLK